MRRLHLGRIGLVAPVTPWASTSTAHGHDPASVGFDADRAAIIGTTTTPTAAPVLVGD